MRFISTAPFLKALAKCLHTQNIAGFNIIKHSWFTVSYLESRGSSWFRKYHNTVDGLWRYSNPTYRLNSIRWICHHIRILQRNLNFFSNAHSPTLRSVANREESDQIPRAVISNNTKYRMNICKLRYTCPQVHEFM